MNQFQKSQSEKILSCYSTDDLQKAEPLEKGGKKAVIGEVRKYGGQDWVKHLDGWVLVHPSGKHILERPGGKREVAQDHHVDHARKHLGQDVGKEAIKDDIKKEIKENSETEKQTKIDEIDTKVAELRSRIKSNSEHAQKFGATDRTWYAIEVMENEISDLVAAKEDIKTPRGDINSKTISYHNIDFKNLGVVKVKDLQDGDWFYDGRKIGKVHGKRRLTSRKVVVPISRYGITSSISMEEEVAKIQPITVKDVLDQSTTTKELVSKLSFLGVDNLRSVFKLSSNEDERTGDVNFTWDMKGEQGRLEVSRTGEYDPVRRDEDGLPYPIYKYTIHIDGKTLSSKEANGGYVEDTELGWNLLRKLYE